MTDERAGDRPEQTDAPRSFVERTKDEVQAWFGDADAAGRRQRDLAVGDHSGKGPENDLDPDARIVADISQRLTDNPAIDASRVKVESRDGLVALSGDVSTAAQRASVEQLAGSVAGVHMVENRLQVI
jgi:osmotically-inducible protein OsmY